MYIDRKFSSLSSSFFKPIVATSLLFLLPSLGMGEDNVYTVGGGGPTIKVTSTEGTTPTYLSWTNACNNTTSCTAAGTSATWTSDSTWSGTINSNKITSLALRFDNTNATSFVYNSTSGSTATAGVYASGANATAISADFQNKSLGTSTNKINLELRFGSSSVANGNKKITVKNLDTLNGTLYVSSTATTTSSSTENAYTYDITLNTLNGILAIQGSNYLLKGTITINSALNGSIYVSGNSSPGTTNSETAALTLNFAKGATMTGDILDRANGQAGIRKDIYFAGSGNVLTGNIVSFGTGSSDILNLSVGNRIYFTQGSMTGYIIASTGQYSASTTGSSASDASRKGLNVVIFGDSGTTTTQNLTGGILASDVNWRQASNDTNSTQATNVIVLADSTTLNINSNGKGENEQLAGSFANGDLKGGDNAQKSDTIFQVTSGSIIARNFGVNEIRIYKDSTLNLDGGNGSIRSVTNDTTSTTTNANGSALNKINFLSEGGKINGSIVADNSKNASGSNKASALIYVANNASGTITGNLTTESNSSGTSGRLTITLGSSNTTSVTGVNTKYATTDSTSTNTSTLTLQGSSNTITGLTTTGVDSSGKTTTTSSGAVNTASLILDSSKSTDDSGQTTTISGTVSNNASALNKHSNQNP